MGIDFLSGSQVTIPARVGPDGTLHFYYGGPMPRLKPGAIVDVVADEYALESSLHLGLLKQGETCEMFPAGTSLLVCIGDFKPYGNVEGLPVDSMLPVPMELRASEKVGSLVLAVELILQNPLLLGVHAGKPETLRPCHCSIPALGRMATSVNQAYTLISEEYEPWRMSHTGNVFEKVYFLHGETSKWLPLKDRRWALNAELEADLKAACTPWWHSLWYSDGAAAWAYFEAPSDWGVRVYIVSHGWWTKGELHSLSTSTVTGQMEFATRDKAKEWFRKNGFQHLGVIENMRSLSPPSPPYLTPRGEEIRLAP